MREDPVRKGLLYAGTERMVHVSFDDGESWQPLRLNMPATSIRDLVVHGDDLVVGTHGRSFWILDDVTPLRQLDAKTAVERAVSLRAADGDPRAPEPLDPTRRFRPKSPRAGTRRTARSSTTSSPRSRRRP